MTHMIHIAATSQLRHDTEGRAYHRRKLAAGKTKAEAMRCLRRRISDTLYRRLRADAERALPDNVETGPGGHHGAALHSSAAGSHAHRHFGPATTRTRERDATPAHPDTEDHQVKNAPTRPLTTEGCRKVAVGRSVPCLVVRASGNEAGAGRALAQVGGAIAAQHLRD